MATIDASSIAEVRARTSLLDLIGEVRSTKRVGRGYLALCPFHNESSPSFSINEDEGVYHCFGCGASGDAITFVQEHNQLDFADAVETLAARSQVKLEYVEGTVHRDNTALYEVLNRAANWYHEQFMHSEQAGAARNYWRTRGYGRNEAETFKIGWAPTSGTDLINELSDVDWDVLVTAGLTQVVGQTERKVDFFQSRLMFPIYDHRDRVIGFGGRDITGEARAKYKNTPDTPLYRKKSVLYGLNNAKDIAKKVENVVVCEGYTDVIGMWKSGIENAVATCGTALTETHVRMLKRFVGNTRANGTGGKITLSLDSDNAGQMAMGRLSGWESQHNVTFYVSSLPEGKDPAELAESDPEGLRNAVQNATLFPEWKIKWAATRHDMTTPEGRLRFANEASADLATHSEGVIRAGYALEIASISGADENEIKTKVEIAAGNYVPDRTVERPAVPTQTEFELLGYVLVHPADVPNLFCLEPTDSQDWIVKAGKALMSHEDSIKTYEAICDAAKKNMKIVELLATMEDGSEPKNMLFKLTTETDDPPTEAEGIETVHTLIRKESERLLHEMSKSEDLIVQMTERKRDLQRLLNEDDPVLRRSFIEWIVEHKERQLELAVESVPQTEQPETEEEFLF